MTRHFRFLGRVIRTKRRINNENKQLTQCKTSQQLITLPEEVPDKYKRLLSSQLSIRVKYDLYYKIRQDPNYLTTIRNLLEEKYGSA